MFQLNFHQVTRTWFFLDNVESTNCFQLTINRGWNAALNCTSIHWTIKVSIMSLWLLCAGWWIFPQGHHQQASKQASKQATDVSGLNCFLLKSC